MRTARARATGFTLVELLVVVAIIGLLVGILVPVVKTAIDSGQNAASMARIIELGDGCYIFKNETGFYPGQQNFDVLKGSGGAYTGSQVLAASLFGCSLADLVSAGKEPPMSGKYAPIKINDLDKFYTGSSWATKYTNELGTILDRFTDGPMAVLYYPSRLNAGSTDASNLYAYDDNSVYVARLYDDYCEAQDKEEGYSQSTYTNEMRELLYGEGYAATPEMTVKNPGGFLVIGAGKDRLYMTSDDLVFP